MTTWIALSIVAVGSYLFRFAPLVALEKVTIPASIERALTHAGPAAMAALTVSALVHDRQLTASVTSAIAAAVALAVSGSLALCRRPFLVSVGVGLAAFVLLDTVLT